MFPAQGQLGGKFPSSEAALAPVQAILSAPPAPISFWPIFRTPGPRLAGNLGVPKSRLTITTGSGRGRIVHSVTLHTVAGADGWQVSYQFDRIPNKLLLAPLIFFFIVPTALLVGQSSFSFEVFILICSVTTIATTVTCLATHGRSEQVERALKVMYNDNLTEPDRLAAHSRTTS